MKELTKIQDKTREGNPKLVEKFVHVESAADADGMDQKDQKKKEKEELLLLSGDQSAMGIGSDFFIHHHHCGSLMVGLGIGLMKGMK